MSRAERLLALIEVLRVHRRPVSGERLAADLGISLRTLYRDIASLQAQGARIDGAPGMGYVLRPGFTLPPLMFVADELEALALGSRWVAEHGDRRLAQAARNALAKIADVLPEASRHDLRTSGLLVGPDRSDPDEDDDEAAPAPPSAGDAGFDTIRLAIRRERKLDIGYRDVDDRATQRTIWPFALGYFRQARVVVAWCELRSAIRHFRTDGIDSLVLRDERYPEHRHVLLAQWRREEGIVLDEE